MANIPRQGVVDGLAVVLQFGDVVERVHDFDGFFVRDFGVGSGVVLKR